jgi:hypothetical protein
MGGMSGSEIIGRPRRARAATGAGRRGRRPSPETALVPVEEDLIVEVDGRGPRGRRITRMARLTGGWIIFGVGVVFVILPVIPGTPLVILAAFMLAPDVPVFGRVLDWSKSRFSHITTGITDVNERFAEDFHRRFTA